MILICMHRYSTHILYKIVQVWRHPNWNKPDTHAHTNRKLVVPRAHERIGRAWNSSWNSSFFIAFFFSVRIKPPCLLAFSDQALHNFRQAAGLAAGGLSRNPVKQWNILTDVFFQDGLRLLCSDGKVSSSQPVLAWSLMVLGTKSTRGWMRRTNCIWRNEDEDPRESIRTASKVHSWNTRTLAGNCMLSIIDINKEWEEWEQT